MTLDVHFTQNGDRDLWIIKQGHDQAEKRPHQREIYQKFTDFSP